MSALWDKDSVTKATGGSASTEFSASRVSIDSRSVQPGDLFVALKGERFDGHEFVEGAFARGAAAAIVEKKLAANGPQVVVPDALAALEALGVFNRARMSAKVVGVTGSVGKTSTKEMLRLALAAHGKTYATTGNYNNHIGTPLNLANTPPGSEFCVFEMGMNHAGEISHLTKMVRPDVAVISNIEAVHLEFFKNVEAIADAKAEIFEGLSAGGAAVLNADQPYLAQLSKKAGGNIITFGESEQSDCRLLDYKPTKAGCTVSAQVFGQNLYYTLSAVGKHWAIISLSVLAVAHALGLDVKKTAAALAGFSEVEGRGRVSDISVSGVPIALINDSYNASPASMRAAFAKTAEVWQARGKHGRKVALLGDMLELGAQSEALHAGLANDLVDAGFDAVFTAGALAKYLYDALPEKLRAGHAASAKELLSNISFAAGDVVLVKGSHGSKMYELADALLSQEGKKHAV